ncbi:chromosome segregation protein SMC [Rubeoparvulum massiliense]|uniref:chromosome segregation protein SMC n=1 Tax=Rubeoparvulum massiliense TaxID=1631346 RepID=UPI00065DFD89|nr:chromosome segregation protein SMC [Rubeoparvulum massiliense]
MYLKSLELKGFKSFAQRTELQFVTGITAVVGPNGSGKSNISDAIRWVLGEQSARSLRGAKMEDIIFAGSDHLKPLNFGEVSLTLDNSDRALPLDFQEVMVTRRLYRSGESEYFINKQACRLKDITELFMDTGLGKEAYSVIGQGRVEEILSSKSEDRRIIFEEAAGIVKYKTRKKEAEKKLEQTEQNLLRLNDIQTELEERLGPLTEQAEKARQYKEFKTELEQTEVGLYVFQIEDVHVKWEEVRNRSSQLQREVNEETTKLRSIEAKYEELRLLYHQLETAQDEHQQQLLELSETIEKLEGQREVLRERLRNQENVRDDKSQQLEEMITKLKLYQEELVKRSKYLQECEEGFAKKEAELAAEEERYQQFLKHNPEELEQLKGDYIDLLNKMAAHRNEQRNKEENLQQLKRRTLRMEEEHQHVLEQEGVIAEALQAVEEELKQLTAEMAHYQHQQKALLTKKEELEEVKRGTTVNMQEVSSHLEHIRSKYEVLKEWQDSFNGFMQGVKEVLKERGHHLQGIHGAVAELIQVEPKVELAIETALGSALQHVVVDDEKVGREAIQLLKARRAGRATFLPLNVIKSRRISSNEESLIRHEQGVLGIASDLVQVTETYRSVIEHLLGNVIIVDQMETANHIASLLRYRFRLVTLEGDVVSPGGAMTGGSVKQNNSHLLGRQRQIDELQDLLERARKKQEELQATMRQQAQELNSMQHQETELRHLIDEKRETLLQVETKRNQLLMEERSLKEKSTLHQSEMNQFQQEITAYQEVLSRLGTELQELELASAEMKEKINSIEDQLKQQEHFKEEHNQTITQLKIAVAEQAEHVRSVRDQVKQLQDTEDGLIAEKDQLQEQLAQGGENAQQWGEQLDSLGLTMEAYRHQRIQLEVTIGEGKTSRITVKEEMDQRDAEIRQCNQRVKILDGQLHQAEVQVNRYDVELDNHLSHLREEYHISYELAKERYAVPENVEEAKRKVSQLKRSITQLGNVNLGAIEELAEVKERYQFLTTQRADLVSAKESLYQVIKEMNEEMTRRFSETFVQIRQQFQQVFTQLFGGGRADLMLTDEEDMLNTGVDIIAQPPGKKLQHLSLLSGGEKALTAIALLFAILQIKPVPFCVLDEVEAALDEANVIRFAQFLRRFSEETQFIVVTHRKGTMEGADVLYGVTMEESGVSKLVSVRLDEGWEISAS